MGWGEFLSLAKRIGGDQEGVGAFILSDPLPQKAAGTLSHIHENPSQVQHW